MHRVNGYRHVVGAEQRLQRDQDLLRQTLLDLRTLGEELHDAVDFRQADHRIFRDIGYRRFTIDGNEMVFAGAGQGDIAHGDHFIDLHFVFNDGDFREARIIQPGEDLIDIHFGDAMRGLHQTVITQIQIQQLHNLGHMTGNQTLACFVINFLYWRTHRRLQPTSDQRFMNEDGFFTQ